MQHGVSLNQDENQQDSHEMTRDEALVQYLHQRLWDWYPHPKRLTRPYKRQGRRIGRGSRWERSELHAS